MRSGSFESSSGDASDSPTDGRATTPAHAISTADSMQPHSHDVPDASFINARSSSITATTTTRSQDEKQVPALQGAEEHTVGSYRRRRSSSQRRRLRHPRALLAAGLGIVLVVAGVLLIGPPLERWQSDEASMKLQLQLERIESSIQLLSVDTVKVVQQAKKFLKQHQKAEISSSARTQLVARVGDESFAAHARERFESHSFVMKEAIVFQSSQKLQINETRERLQALNISLPVPREQKKRKTFQPTKAQLLQLQQIQRRQDELNGKIVSLVVDAAKEAVVEQEEQRQRADAKFLLDSLWQLEKEVEARNKRQKSKNGGAFFFYAFVMCLTGGYLWTAAAERKRLAPVKRERPWSPIPTFMIQIKDLFKSIVVIEDLRKQNELLADASDAEDDLGNLMVRTFVPQTPKLISKSSIPNSTQKL